jgi:hypothetical protein
MGDPRSALYVATDLDTWEAPAPVPADQDAICEPCGYRRLDPVYYAWLRHRMEVAQRAQRAGRLGAEQFEGWRRRFNAIHAWAVARFGEAVLVAAVRTLDPKAYRPPQIQDWEPAPQPAPPVHLSPADGDWRFTERVSPEAVAQVDAIRDQALALGWSESRLYQNRGHLRFPVGGDYGLVCYLHSGARVNAVTAQWIEIVRPRGSRLRLHRQDPAIRAHGGSSKIGGTGSDVSTRAFV